MKKIELKLNGIISNKYNLHPAPCTPHPFFIFFLLVFAVNIFVFLLSSPGYALIDKTDGNLKIMETDFSIPNGDLPLELKRFYNLAEMDGGWYFSTHPELIFRDQSRVQFMASGIATGGDLVGYRTVTRSVSRRSPPTRSSYVRWRFDGKEYMFYNVKLNREVTSASDSDYSLTKEKIGDAPTHHILPMKSNNTSTFSSTSTPGIIQPNAIFRYIVKSKKTGMQYVYMASSTDNSVTPTEYISPTGNKLIFVSDISGRILKIKDVNNRAISFEYDGEGRIIGVNYPPNRKIKYSYNADGMLSSVTNAMGVAKQYTYGKTLPKPDYQIQIIGRPPLPSTYGKALLISMTDWNGNTESYAYDDKNRVVKYINAMGNATNYAYTDSGSNISTTITNSRGHSTTYKYTKFKKGTKLTSIVDPLGNTETLTWDAAKYVAKDNPTMRPSKSSSSSGGGGGGSSSASSGMIIKVCPPNCGSQKYRKNFNANLLTYTDKNGNTTSYKYDSYNNLIWEKNALSQVTEYGYDNPSTRVVTRITKRGGYSFNGSSSTQSQKTRFVYLQNQRLLKEIIDPLGNSTKIDYYPFGRIKSKTDAEGNTTYFEYDKWGNVSKVIDPLGNITTMAYDEGGRLLLVSNALGFKTRFVWDNLNRLENIINDSGYATKFSFDNNGNITQSTDADNNSTTYKYDKLNRTIEVIDALNHSTKYSYVDGACTCNASAKDVGLVTSITDEEGHFTNFQYDELNRLIKEIDNTSQETVYTYDKLDNILTKTDPNGLTVSYTYDKLGNLLSQTDAENNTTSFTYDGFGRVISETDALGNKIEYTYDANDNRKSIKDARGNVTRYTYDSLNRVVATLFPNSSAESYSYNENGNLITKTDQKNNTITYAYDNINRLITKQYPDSTAVSYAYDNLNRMTSVSDPNSTISYTYDLLNRITQTNQSGNIVAYEYDAVGRRTKLTYPDGSYITYVHDTLNRLDQIVNSSGQVISDYTYDTLNRRTSANLLNGTQSEYQYDSAGRLTNLANKVVSTDAIISSFVYGYDNANNRTSMVTTEGTHSYTYDDTYQLVNVDYPDSSGKIFEYDAVGNRISTANGGTATYTTNNMNQYTDVAGDGYSYDANGNMTSNGVNVYSYDYENRLVQVNTLSDTVTYTYDALGRRISKRDSSGTEKYLYDGNQVIVDTDSIGAVVAKYVYGTGIDEVVSMEKGGSSYYYHLDGLGSVSGLTDSSGAVVEEYKYDVYGQPYVIDGGGSLISESAVGNRYMFTSREWEKESGIYYYRARMYDPGIGRFLQVDLIGYAGGDINLYRYVMNNPIIWIDSLGFAIGQPGFGESLIPVWGSGRAAIDNFQQGNYLRGSFDAALAVSDVFLVKAVVTGIGKGLVKTSGKFAWPSVRNWLGKKGFAQSGQHVHHWLIPRNTWGKVIPDYIKNQPWNLMPMKGPAFHTALHGWGPNAMNMAQRLFYGSPGWAKAFLFSTLGRLYPNLFCSK